MRTIVRLPMKKIVGARVLAEQRLHNRADQLSHNGTHQQITRTCMQVLGDARLFGQNCRL